MNRHIGWVCVAIAALAFCASGFAAEFSAELTMRTGPQVGRGRVYVKNSKIRVELPQAGSSLIFVGKSGEQTYSVIAPRLRVYCVDRSAPPDDALSDKWLVKMADKKVLGRETINGYLCEKTLYTYRDKSRGSQLRWNCIKLKVPLKTVDRTRQPELTTVFSHIREQKLPDSLFRIPSGYKRVTPGQLRAMCAARAQPKRK